MYKQQKTAVALAVLAALGAAFSAGAQQTNQNNKAEETEVIEVKGFRDSVIKAKDLKREAMVAQDSIVAEDIADFPDQNLADSLQRVPGIAITREGGEGRQISLRGLGPDFTRVQVNGMEALGTSSSPMDSRGAVGRSRAFDFNIFASELFNQIDVKKSYSADQEEGGIGGIVNLRTAKPFDYDGFQGAVAGQVGSNSNSDATKPRLAAMVSNTWGKFGALASVAYSQKESSEVGYNTIRWRQVASSNIGTGVDAATAAKVKAGQVWFARGNRYSEWNNEQERLGMTAAFQYRPSDDLKFALDIMHGKLDNEGDEHHISTGGASSTALGRLEEIKTIDNNGDIEAVYARFSNVVTRTENRSDLNNTTFDQVTFSTNWQATDKLGVVFQLGTSSSDYEQPRVDKVNLTRTGGTLTTDFTQDRFYGINTYDFDPAATAGWTVNDLYFREDYISNDFDNAKVDFDYALTDSSTLTFGANFKKFSNVGENREDAGYVQSKATPLNNGVKTINADVVNVFQHPNMAWLQADVDALQKFYGIHNLALGTDKIIQTNSYTVEEESNSLYSQYAWDSMLGGKVLRGSIGVRYYKTDLTSIGVSKGLPVEISRDYSGVLPTLNLVYELEDDLLLRFGASKKLNPAVIKCDFSVSANVAQMTGSPGEVGKITVGNPNLEPFESVNFDLALEKYYEGVGSLSAAVFKKDIENFIVTEVTTMKYSDTGLPTSLLPNGATVDTLFDVTSPQNSDKSAIKGAELAYQRDLDFLPEPFNQLGVIANYTWVDGTALYRNVQGTGQTQEKSFPGLSKNSYNLTFYFETDKFGARIAAAHRADYISVVEGGLRDEDERGFHATTFVDFSAFYQFSENLKFTIEGINLTNQREEQYSDSNDRPYNTTTSGRTYSAGFSYKF